MPDDHTRPEDAVDDGELLAAYLDGETDDITTARLERRLADDAALAERLDAIAQVRVRLQRVAEVTAPDAARRRLRDELTRIRSGHDAVTDPTSTSADSATPAAPDPPTQSGHRRWWARRPGPALAAAAIVIVTLVGAAALLRPIGGVEGADEAADGDAMVEDAAAEAAGAGDGGESGLQEEQGAEAAGDAAGAGAPAAAVESDAEIAARARELRASPPDDLRAREESLRAQAGLPTGRLCVTELDAATVDLVDEDGRVALAVLLSDVDQIVLLVPRTCAAIRTIPASR